MSRPASLFFGCAATAALLMIIGGSAYAQSDSPLSTIPGEGSAMSITATPAAPGPHQSVQLSAQSPLFNLGQATLTWSSSGKVIAQGQGQTSATITTGALGSQTTVSVSTQTPDGSSASASVTIIPTQVDLLFDADSYTPPFYQGRALPSPQSSLRLQAIAHFLEPDGSQMPSSQIIYTWKQDGEVIGSASGIGRSTAVLPSPSLDGTDVIEVDAASTDGIFSGAASVSIPSVDPGITLYEDHPLFGVMYWNALGAQNSISDSEMTFAATPYFAPAAAANDPALEYEWSVNGNPIANAQGNGNELTVDASKSGQSATIALTLTSGRYYLLDGSGSWAVQFGQAGGGASGGSANVFDYSSH